MAITNGFILPHPPLIIPEVGKGEQKRIQDTIDACEQVGRMVAQIQPDTLVIATPHSVMYGDYIHISPGAGARGDFGSFGAPEVAIEKEYDSAFVSELEAIAGSAGIAAGTLGEKDARLDHATMVPLYFIDKHYADCRLVRVSISGLSYFDHYRFGQCIAGAADTLNTNVVFIASGDLSHKLIAHGPYGMDKAGPKFDKQITDAMKAADFLQFLSFDEHFCEAAAECGLRSCITLAGALDGKAVQTQFLSYEGPFGVGYAVCGYSVTGDDERRKFGEKYKEKQQEKLTAIQKGEDEYVKLARMTLEAYVKDNRYIKIPNVLPTEMLGKKAGVFVSLKKHGRLRGCIGTIEPTQDSIAQEIIKNAVSAGTGDPRFDPVTADELPALVYSVDVLSEAEAIQSIDQLDVKRYGVIVTKGYKRGLLLPGLDGVDTPEQQVEIALQKAGIAPHGKYEMERFEVVRHK